METETRMTRTLPAQPADLAELDVEDLIHRPGVYIVTITPDMAKKLLERNINNRPLQKRAIETYASDMRMGRWRVTGQGLGYDRMGNLIDGQNRLHACMEANTPFDTVVATGLEPEAKDVVDTGVKRTFAHVLRMHGHQNVMQLSGGVALRMRYDKVVRDGLPWHTYSTRAIRASHDEQLEYLHAHPSLDKSILRMNLVRAHFPILPASAIIAFVSMGLELDEEGMGEFIQRFVSGAGLETDDPLLTLRNYIARVPAVRRGGPSSMQWLALLIKAWNDWRMNVPREVYTMRDNELMPQMDKMTAAQRYQNRQKKMKAAS
jgi:hypothetical protein